MNDAKWERWGLLGGIEAVVLILVSAFLSGTPPDTDATGAEIAAWYADNDSTIRWSAFLVALAVIGLSWWVGSLWRHMRRAEGGEARLSLIAFAGFVFSGTLAMIGFAVHSALASRIEDIGDGAGVLYGLTTTLFGFSTVGDVVSIAAVSALAIRTKFLPNWLAYAGAAIAVVQLLGALTVATDSTAVAVIGFIALLTWLAWIVAVSLVLYLKK